MEEKLLKLAKVSNEFSDKSEKYYISVGMDFGTLKDVQVSIRNKKDYKFVETREIYLEEIELSKIDELIEFIKSYEVK